MSPKGAKINGCYQFALLMWKVFLLRKRHYIVTIVELLLPILITSIPVIILQETARSHNSRYGPQEMSDRSSRIDLVNKTIFPPFSPFEKYHNNRMHFIYTPKTDDTILLMNTAVDFWRNKSKFSGKMNISDVSNEIDMEIKSLELQADDPFSSIIGIVFNENVSPNSLKYKLRYVGGNFETGSAYPPFRVSSNMFNSYINVTTFLGIQAAIDHAFISLKLQMDLPTEVFMQYFPYPSYEETMNGMSPVDFAGMLLTYGLYPFIIALIKRVVEEKANRSKELLKMMGMTDFIYWSSTFTSNFIFAFVICLVSAILYCTPFNPGASLLKKTDFFLCLVILLLIAASTILFCLTVSALFNRPVFAIMFMIILWTLTSVLLSVFLFTVEEKYLLLKIGSKLAICLLPTGAILVVFKMMSLMELRDVGAQWSNMGKFILSPDLNLAMVMAMMLLSCFIYSILLWYIDAVWPWQYGVPKPFYFPFTKSYWCGYQKFENEINAAAENPFLDYFEEEPTGISPGVVINHLSKVFRTGLRTKTAVDDVSLNIYKGQITALLGHNGAGKTTTINMLTGLYCPSQGSASIDGWDILTRTREARSQMGICPQHNVLYDSLTVEEHLKIYAGLKGVKWQDLGKEVHDILHILQLSEKKHEPTKNLSGGMKRKLSLGIAIVGGSKVLFLDEPTSGLDPEARRSIWDILLNIRQNRTIILTTHYMEEADILGERIAIMADGKIRCCGSPLFLKKKFGTGYRFHLVKSSRCNLEEVTAILQKHVPDTTLENATEKDVTYSLAGSTLTSFGKMFELLEYQKDSLGISSFGLSVTTMEDVFLKVTTLADRSFMKSSKSDISLVSTNNQLLNGEGFGDDTLFHYTKHVGNALFLQQMRGLLLKRLHHAKRHWGAIFPRLVIPFLLLLLLGWVLKISRSADDISEKPVLLNLKSIYGSSKGFYHYNGANSTFAEKYLKGVLSASDVNAIFVDNPVEYMLGIGTENVLDYTRDYLVGGSSITQQNKSMSVTAWFNGKPYHTAPASLNIMNTALLRYWTDSEEASIEVINSPLPYLSNMRMSFNPISVKIYVAAIMPIIFAFLSASYVLVVIHENTSRAKLLQLMTGVSLLAYWSSMLLWDLLVHSVCCILLLIPFSVFNGNIFFGHSEAIGAVFLLLFLYGWCSIPLSYLISLLVKKPATGFSLLVVFNLISGLIPALVFSMLGNSRMPNEEITDADIAMWFMQFFPTFSVSWGLGNLFDISFANAYCDEIPETILRFVCGGGYVEQAHVKLCCKDEHGDRLFNKTYPITWDKNGCGREITFMCIDGILYLSILIFCESSMCVSLCRSIKNLWNGRNLLAVQPAGSSNFADSDVLNEAQRIEMLDESNRNENAFFTLGLTKYYKNLCAVDHLTFGVKLEECFGLLGINGAGKTSTFKMLVGDIQPSCGNAFINNSSLQQDFKKFQSYVGYCPQYDALIDRLTGREMLTLFARLRGIPENCVNGCVSKFITMVDLQDHSDKLTSLYSGGNKRKLSLALAVIGSPAVIFLDEPTSGVDPAARRKIWNVLSLVRSATGSSIILTTHSMEESEALCNRLAIMVNGQFRCMGSIQELKAKFAQGYTVIAKLTKEQVVLDPLMINAKAQIEGCIPSASLKDGHQGMLHYHVSDTSVPWSRLFYIMEELKETLHLEDYLISDTTLEQIFLAFARSQRLSSEATL